MKMTQQHKSHKLGISIPDEMWSYTEARRKAFAGQLSKYIQHLISQEMLAQGREVQSRESHRTAVIERLGVPEGKHPAAGIVGDVGVYPVLGYEHEDVLREVSIISRIVGEHKLKRILMVLPEDSEEEDLVNWGQVYRHIPGVEIEVTRLGSEEWLEAKKAILRGVGGKVLGTFGEGQNRQNRVHLQSKSAKSSARNTR